MIRACTATPTPTIPISTRSRLEFVVDLPGAPRLGSARASGCAARAADSELYLASSSLASTYHYFATQEAPRLIAKSVKWWVDSIKINDVLTNPWVWWPYNPPEYSTNQGPEDLHHAQFSLGTILVIWENRTVIDGLLARYGFAERVEGPNALNAALFTNIANTFLTKVWYYDPDSNLRNLLSTHLDGPPPIPTFPLDCGGQLCNENKSATAFIGLTSFNSGVWARSRDSGKPRRPSALPVTPVTLV